MKRKISLEKIIVGLIVLVLAVAAFTASFVVRDIQSAKEQLSKESYGDNATIYAKYIDGMLRNYIESATVMGRYLSNTDFANTKDVYEVMSGQNSFHHLSIIDTKGHLIAGEDLGGSSFYGTSEYNSVIEGLSLADSVVTTDIDGKEVLRFFAPIRKSQKTTMILIGSVRVQDFYNMFNNASFKENGSICIFDTDGEYVFGDDNFKTMLRDKESNHFSHLRAASPVEDGISTKLAVERIEKGEFVNLDYIYSGEEYTTRYLPMGVNHWVMCVTVPTKNLSDNGTILSNNSKAGLTASAVVFVMSLIAAVLFALFYSRLRKENDRHIAVGLCDDAVTFDLSFKPHIVSFYGDVKKMLGVDLGPLKGEAVYDVYDWVHEDDKSVRSRLHQFYDEGKEDEHFNAEIRIRNIWGDYGWARVTGMLQKDKKGKTIGFVGKIFNVDEQLNEEKKLVQRAENDLLTGVLNKKTLEKRADLKVKERDGQYVIFYMIDLDNFKNVNDKLGHIYGDQAIVETAQCLNKVFANQDCIGRLGGDEFAVCVAYRAFDEESLRNFIKKKAEEICEVNRRTYTDGATSISISSSVGIAYAPDMGSSFNELYQKADTALYVSKENGKNTFHIYSERDERED